MIAYRLLKKDHSFAFEELTKSIPKFINKSKFLILKNPFQIHFYHESDINYNTLDHVTIPSLECLRKAFPCGGVILKQNPTYITRAKVTTVWVFLALQKLIFT